jgi:hypothetical protein
MNGDLIGRFRRECPPIGGSMPTAHQYRQAAAEYAALSENLRRQSAQISGWHVDEVIGGGALQRIVVEQLTSVADELRTSAEAFEQLVGECRWRASVCDDYIQGLNEFLAQPVVQRLGRPFPSPPYVWVAA